LASAGWHGPMYSSKVGEKTERHGQNKITQHVMA
jgi:hypothetical protein